MELISSSNDHLSSSVTERKKNPLVNVKIGGGLGAVVLVGGVLATTALASALFSRRRRGKKSDQVENEAVFSVVQPSFNTTREANPVDTINQISSSPTGNEISDGKLEGVSPQPNVESICAVEGGDVANSCTGNTESHEDSMEDGAQRTETGGDNRSYASSQPNGQVIHVAEMAENASGDKDYKLDQIDGIESNGGDTLDDVSAQLNKQLLCDKINAANDDSICSTETTVSLEDHILSEVPQNERTAVFTPDLSAEPKDIICYTEKIQPHENSIQDEIPGTEVESIRLKLSHPSLNVVESIGDECHLENFQTSIQDEMPLRDETGHSVETIDDASEERKQVLLELVGKLRQDRLLKDDGGKPGPEDKDAAMNKYAIMANQATRRRMLIGAVSVATSLAMSNLTGLSFVKLCLIMLLTGVLSEIHGR